MYSFLRWQGVDRRRCARLAESVRLANELFAIYPLWVGPVRVFEHRLYRKIRSKYAAEKAFPEVYDKVTPESWLM